MTQIPQIRYDGSMEPIVTGGERIVPTRKQPKLAVVIPEKNQTGRVSIIILAWNQLHYTKICIGSIKASTERSMYDLIVVDQGSKDKTIEYLESVLDGPGDKIIRNIKNEGFAGANNQGLQLAEAEYVLMLNNDCNILKTDWLDLMLNAARDNKDVGLFGSVCMKAAPDYRNRTLLHIGAGRESDKWSYLEGWCLFGKRDLFLKLNGFDMRFNPAYGEDSDMCFRVKKMGLKIKALKLPIKHYGNKSKKQLDETVSGQAERSMRAGFDKWIGGNGECKSMKKEEPKQIKTILIKRKGARGDVLLTTPIIRELKKKFPESVLVYETDCPDILARNPHISRIEKIVPRQNEFDLVFAPRYEVDMAKNAIDTMAKQCNVTLSSKKLEIYLTDNHTRWAKNKVNCNKINIAIHTGRAWKSKEWPFAKFIELAKYYNDKGYGIIETGNKQTQYTGVGTDCRGCSIKQTAALISECSIFVGIDSGNAHLAKAVGTPACVIYGSVDPVSPKSDAVEYPIRINDLECKGCRGRTSAEWVDCCKPEVYCLNRITPEMVIATINRCIAIEIESKQL